MEFKQLRNLFCFVLSIISFHASAMFSSADCIGASFSKNVELPKKFFGVFKRDIMMTKERCILSLRYKYSFWFSKWEVDICRDPIHVRYENFFGPELLRKDGECEKNSQGVFCQKWKELQSIIDNELLIYAEGERDQLNSLHGTSYCLDLLFKGYLSKNFSFSMETLQNYNLFKNEVIEVPLVNVISGQAPVSTDVITEQKKVEF
jgi:hypothetical protein